MRKRGRRPCTRLPLQTQARAGCTWIPATDSGSENGGRIKSRCSIPRPKNSRNGPYDAVLDKAGNVWTGSMSSDTILRLNPKTGEYRQYLMPLLGINVRRID